MIRVLHFASSFPREADDLSGIFIKRLAMCTARTFQTYILAPDSIDSQRIEKSDDIVIFRYPYFIKKYQKLVYRDSILQNLKRSRALYFQVPFFLFFAARFFRRIVDNYRIDLVHAHWIFPQGFIAVLMKKMFALRCRIIITSHGGDIFALRSAFFKKIKRYTLRHCDYINAVSFPIKEKIESDLGITDKTMVIPMGTDYDLFTGRTARPLESDYVLFVGRLTEKKGVVYLVDAFARVCKENPSLKLVIIGSGHQKERLRDRVEELGIQTDVIFIDSLPQRQLVPYYQHARIFVGPSIVSSQGDTEGFGLVFVEAMLSRCPIIATRTGGIPDIVTHGETGFLVEQKRADQIADAILTILNDKKVEKKLVKNGFDCARQQFTWSAVEKKFDGLYRRVLGLNPDGFSTRPSAAKGST